MTTVWSVWKDEPRARLVPGCSAFVDGQRRTIDWIDRYEIGVDMGNGTTEARQMTEANPHTLRPPTLARLRAMALEKLGADARVELTMSGRVAREVGVYSMREDGLERALFIGDRCREHAARWLASLPEVSP